MFYAGMVANLWDLADGGIDQSLDAIQAVGATSLTVVVTSPPVAELRSAAGMNPRIFRSDGGYFFHPDETFYADTRLKPIAASWLKGRDPLANVADACTRLSLPMNLRISALRVGRIGARHPEATAKTAQGDPLPEVLCPANPDVRALLRGTVKDLSQRYFPSGIEVADLAGDVQPAGQERPAAAFPAGDGFWGLMGLCFCESSRQRAADAGVDASAAARWVQVRLDRALTSGEAIAGPVDGLIAESEIVSAYARTAVDAAGSLFESLARAGGCDVDLVAGLGSQWGHPKAKRVIVGCPFDTDEPFMSFARRTRDRWGEKSRIVLEFAAGDVMSQPQRLVSTVKQAAEEGFSGVNFSHFGSIPARCLDTIKQAVRFAVRSTS